MVLRNPFVSDIPDEPPPPITAGELPTYLAWAVVGFCRSWLQSRRIVWLIQGVPVLVLAVALGVLFVSGDQAVSSSTIQGYLNKARKAGNREEYEEAEFYFRKLESLAPFDRAVVREHAEIYAKQGNFPEAFRLMESLVEDEGQTDDVEIHLWLAETALNEDVGLVHPFEYAKHHLLAVLEDDPKNLKAQYFFTRLHVGQNDIPSAIQHLQHIAAYDAQLQLLLASLYLRLDPPDKERSRAMANSAVDTLSKIIRETQPADVTPYHQLASGHGMVGDFAKAEQVLKQALTKFDQESTRRQLSRTYVAWSDSVVQKNATDISGQIELLEKALVVAPNEPLALNRILAIASSEGSAAELAEQRLRKALVDGIAPSAVHFSLGSLAAKRGDTETAMRHFRQSQQLNPRTAVTLNNIAYLMAQTIDADLDQALEMAQQAVQMAPAAAPFRDTRGQILARMGRWNEAIADLEYANSKMEDVPSLIVINNALAKCYEGLGDEATAAAYRQKEEQLRKSVAGPDGANGDPSLVTPKVDFDKLEKDKQTQAVDPPDDE